MNLKEFVELAVRTKSDTFSIPTSSNASARGIDNGQGKPNRIPDDVLHAVIGISTEAGELLDVVKKNMFYGKPIDYVNLDEEMGDVLWYIAVYHFARGRDIEATMVQVIEKLKVRFPDKFSDTRALERNLPAERQVLEAHSVENDLPNDYPALRSSAQEMFNPDYYPGEVEEQPADAKKLREETWWQFPALPLTDAEKKEAAAKSIDDGIKRSVHWGMDK